MVVYSVYLAAGALAAAGAATLAPPRALGSLVGSAPLFSSLLSSVPTAATKDGGVAGTHPQDSAMSGLRLVPGLLLWYAALNLTSISYLFYLRVCHNLMGKDIRTGQIPWWSYVIFWPFHVVNLVLVYSKRFIFRRHVPLASEVLPDLWVGTYFSDVARAVEWQGIVDLTTEFSERSRARNYLCLPSWDGLPATDKDLTRGASFILEHWKQGPILCHCAAGIGRSATMVCAALILAEKASSVDEAEAMIREKRPIVRLNAKMRMALEAWSSNLDALRPNTDSAAATATTDM